MSYNLFKGVRMTKLNVEISNELNNFLTNIAKQLHRQEDNIVREALQAYLEEMQEDIEDAEEALKRLNQNSKTIPWEQVQRECGLLEN